jgi:glutamyl-tRNA synthetase
MSNDDKVRTRFAPSPTGYLHIGGARTALFNWLYARHYGGKFILRIEDTDQERSTEESTRAIFDAMTWLGLNWDEGPYYQAERIDRYREAVRRLLDEGKAFRCVCTPDMLEEKRKKALAEGRKPKYDGTCREKNIEWKPGSVVRFRTSQAGTTTVNDLIKGAIPFNNEELDDLIIERSDGYPTYNFAVVVDDAEMGITHVIRGDDHLNNTPRQILLYKALGQEVPKFAHVPMILGSDKARLSKRHGATSVMAYQEMGYLPEAIVNYLVRLGWSYGDQEIFSPSELIRYFSLESVGRSAAIFNPEKLLWLNQHYIKEGDSDRIAQLLVPFLKDLGVKAPDRAFVKKVVEDLKPRSRTLVEMAKAGAFYFRDDVEFDEVAFENVIKVWPIADAMATITAIQSLPEQNLTKPIIETTLKNVATRLGKKLKDIIQPIRVALTGRTVSPGIDQVIITLGPGKTVARMKKALELRKSE